MKIVCEERTDEGLRLFKDGCCGTIRTIDGGGDKRVIEVNRLGNIYGEDKGTGYAGNVWDKDNLCPTLTTMQGGNREPMIVASRGRNPQNPSDRTPGADTEQRLEPTVKIKQATKDGYIECKLGGVADLSYPTSKTRRGRVQDNGDTCPTLTATETGICRIETPYRIRKLTPLECWRLMNFTDEDFHKAEAVNSNTQLYKQAGNSIVKAVLVAIFKQMLPN